MANVVSGKGTNFITVKFDGSTDFDLCTYLGAKTVTVCAIAQLSVAVNDTLTVRDGSATGNEIYGPYVDVTGGGTLRYYIGRTMKPYVKGSEATANSKAQFEVEYVT